MVWEGSGGCGWDGGCRWESVSVGESVVMDRAMYAGAYGDSSSPSCILYVVSPDGPDH